MSKHKPNLFISLFSFFIIGAAVFTLIYAEVSFNFSGGVEYRYRLTYFTFRNADGNEVDSLPSKADYQHKYAWNLGMQATINDNLYVGMMVMNPSGLNLDNVSNLPDISGFNEVLSIPNLYLHFQVQNFYLEAGVIPVGGNFGLDMAAHDCGKPDTEAGCYDWGGSYNESQKGSKIGLTFMENEETSVGAEFIYSLAEDKSASKPGRIFRKDQFRYIFNVPMSFLNDKFTLHANFNIKSNHYRSADTKEGNHTFASGINIGINPVEQFSVALGFGIGGFNNSSIEGEPIYNDQGIPIDSIAAYEPLAYGISTGFDFKLPYGKYELDFMFFQGNDRAKTGDDEMKSNFMFYNTRYSMPVKKLTIQPRLRIYHFFNSKNDAKEVRLRPELILSTSF